MPSDPTPSVVVAGLVVTRGRRRALNDLTMTLPRGRLIGLLGPSGCGKSTLMRAIVGVQRVQSGTVTVLGKPAGDPALRSHVAYTTQTPALYPDLTVAENIRYFARILHVADGEVDRVIATVSLENETEQRANSLSGGQRARLALATALLGEPDLLVLDEPTVGLDPLLRRSLWSMFRRLADAGATLIISSHVLDEAEHCDDLILMREGSVITYEPRRALQDRMGGISVEEAFIRLVESAP